MKIDRGADARDRRTLVGGALTIAVLVAVARGLPALREWTNSRRAAAAAVDDQRRLAERARRVLPAMEDSLQVRRARFASLDSLLIVASSASVAAAALASLLEDIASDARIKVNAMQMRPDTTSRPGITRVAVRLTGVGDVAGLASFLRAVDGGDRYLAVRELAVSQPEPGAPASKPETLRVDVLVEGLGFIQPGAAK
jgi:hypothetical protein